MAFRFSLTSVLRFRESVEKQEELVLQKIQIEVARVQRHIDQLTNDLIDALDARDKALEKPTPALYLQGMQAEMAAAMDAKQNLSEMLEGLNEQREKQIGAYRSARTKRRMLTDLLEQQKSLWEHQQLRAQQKMLDEIFSAQAKRS